MRDRRQETEAAGREIGVGGTPLAWLIAMVRWTTQRAAGSPGRLGAPASPGCSTGARPHGRFLRPQLYKSSGPPDGRLGRHRRCVPGGGQPSLLPGPGGPFQVPVLYLSGTLEPDTWVDITATIEAKAAALACHASQIGPGGEWLGKVVRERAEEAGRLRGCAICRGVPKTGTGMTIEHEERERPRAREARSPGVARP